MTSRGKVQNMTNKKLFLSLIFLFSVNMILLSQDNLGKNNYPNLEGLWENNIFDNVY